MELKRLTQENQESSSTLQEALNYVEILESRLLPLTPTNILPHFNAEIMHPAK